MPPAHSRRSSAQFIQRRGLTAAIRRRPVLASSIGFLVALGVLALVVVPPIYAAVRYGNAAKGHLQTAQRELQDQHFREALASIDAVQTNLEKAKGATGKLRGLWPVPMLGTQLRASDDIIVVGSDLAVALKDGTRAIQQILEPIQAGKDTVSLATLTPADKRQILSRLADTEPLLESVRNQILLASQHFASVPKHGLIKPINNIAQPLREQLPFLQDTVIKFIPATQIIPAIAGFPNAKTYLFLLQNNTELRPTGGFIGTYGVLKVAAGEITSFTTKDVYTLDTPVKDALHINPPEPLRRYNATTQWFFRDGNWSPNFPTSAETLLDFYRRERGPEKQFDGVIAVTPVFISSLLKISGNITVGNITFTPDNLVDKLQPLADRKELIGDMSKILINRILALPQRRWQELITAIVSALEEKQMLLYARDASLEQKLLDQRWGGELVAPAVDGLAVVDANLASLKTDSVMGKTIDYQLSTANDEAMATAKITYTNRGTFSKMTTRYRTYTRLYVPLGSTLISSEGAMRDDKIRGGGKGAVDTGEEHGQTVFGAFISIEPGASGTLTFTYKLPQKVLSSITDGEYTLAVQKQAGTVATGLTGTLRFPKPVRLAQGIDGLSVNDHTAVSLSTDLSKDRFLTVSF